MAIQEGAFTPSFTTVPILPLSQARDPKTKPAFLKDLRDTLLNVGFLYISETGLPEDLVKRVCELTQEFFDENVLPLEEKERIEMKNEKSFLGWSRVSQVSLITSNTSQAVSPRDTKS
jgi:isopenicillin N synthase-like dioxygenase